MDQLVLLLIVLILASICDVLQGQWQRSSEDRMPTRDSRRGVHYHTKRHMLTGGEPKGSLEAKKQTRQTSPVKGNLLGSRSKVNYKPSGHLTPLKEDDIDNDEVISVAIGPPPMRPTYEKTGWKQRSKNFSGSPHRPAAMMNDATAPQGAVTLVKDVLSQIAQEFVSHQVNEDFVFGQYVGHAMKNISIEFKLKFQHEVLDLVMRYQNMRKREPSDDNSLPNPSMTNFTISTKSNFVKTSSNDTDDNWPDFNNLAKIVG